jgi:phosphoserine phosphatase RsbX
MHDAGQVGALEWAIAATPMPGQDVSGDQYVVVDAGDSVLLGVIDGLGHGPAAAEAAFEAIKVLTANAGEPLDALIYLCHQSLAETRGVAMTLARFTFDDGELTWLGVGNVLGVVVRNAPVGSTNLAVALVAGGIVGHQLPPTMHIRGASMHPGDVLLLGTDGLRPHFIEDPPLAQEVPSLADDILTRCRKDTDDALILAARYRGLAR